MRNDNDDDNTIYRGYLVDAYLKRAGSFRKLFISLLGFTAAFGFFIAWPYLSAVQQEAQLVSDISKLDSEVSEMNSLYSRYKQPKKMMNALQKNIKQGPLQLRNFIKFVSQNVNADYPYTDNDPTCQQYMEPSRAQGGLPFDVPNVSSSFQQASPPPQSQIQQSQPASSSSLRRDSCAGSQGVNRDTCRVDRFVQYQLCGYEQSFTKRILPALATLQEENSSLFDSDELERQFNVVRESLRQHVADNPTFWHTYRDKTGMSIKFNNEIKKLWSAIAIRMEPVMKGLGERITNIRDMRTSLKKDRDALKEQREKLMVRLTRIQSPIGNLPIGLTEAVLLFPIILVIGFCMATASLLEQLRLRTVLRDSEADVENTGNILSSKELAKVSPLWIESSNTSLQKFGRWLLMLIPVLAYLGTVAALLRKGHNEINSVLQQSAVNEWVYSSMYIIGGLVFGICLILVSRAMCNLQKK